MRNAPYLSSVTARYCSRMYIDPGFGALLLQGFVAGILGATFAARQKIRRWLRKLMGKAVE